MQHEITLINATLVLKPNKQTVCSLLRRQNAPKKYEGCGKRGQPHGVKGKGSVPAQHLFLFYFLLLGMAWMGGLHIVDSRKSKAIIQFACSSCNQCTANFTFPHLLDSYCTVLAHKL